ncbi:ArsC family reductase [Aquabacter spiritensis]|uniref:ArsR family transcriptional regulator n=1 Tax=Aquabacter spiritensis TaxID=933073 RepID=A0A4R3M3I9_9HYPH|nr:ArsC family reductase [Aquabacter spiritensis]TCT07760.1 ArsR family transcriptional regulator [Aquabacter spiritensis]
MAHETTIYGIKTCDTMKKARAWLTDHAIACRFHDYRTDGLTPERLGTWVDALGWEVLLNRAGTTFRALPDAEKQGIDRAAAIRLMLAQPAMIKRPVLDFGGRLIVGFKPDVYKEALLQARPAPAAN